MNGITAEGDNLKEYIFLDESAGTWCISNTMVAVIYTALSFLSICFCVMGRQIILSKT